MATFDPRLGEFPEYCDDPLCRHTNWGGRGRKHKVMSDCRMVMEACKVLNEKLNAEFLESLMGLPHMDNLAGIRYDRKHAEVIMPIEAFKALAGFFKQAEYALRQPDGGVYELPGLDFKAARDLAEIGGAQLLQKFETGWFDA